MNPPAPKKNITTSTRQAYLINLMALGYLLTDIKFLKSFKFFRSSDYDLESDRSYLCKSMFVYFIDLLRISLSYFLSKSFDMAIRRRGMLW